MRRGKAPLTEDQQTLVRLYNAQPTTVDRLAYTSDFARLYRDYIDQTGQRTTKRRLLDELTNLRKKGVLGGKRQPALA